MQLPTHKTHDELHPTYGLDWAEWPSCSNAQPFNSWRWVMPQRLLAHNSAAQLDRDQKEPDAAAVPQHATFMLLGHSDFQQPSTALQSCAAPWTVEVGIANSTRRRSNPSDFSVMCTFTFNGRFKKHGKPKKRKARVFFSSFLSLFLVNNLLQVVTWPPRLL